VQALSTKKVIAIHCFEEVRFARDSPLEEAGFEPSVPPERKAVPSAIARSFGNPPASLAAVGDPR
jgi:hypothetical protein